MSKLIDRDGLAIPIELLFVEVTCRRRKPKVTDFKIFWPTLSMESGVNFLWKAYPRFLLGGLDVQQDWKGLFRSSWEQFRMTQPSHQIFDSHLDLSVCVPYYTHGDEGQTLRKCPFMVESWQPAISWKGIDHTTMSG